MASITNLRETPRLTPPGVLQSRIADAYNGASNALANDRRQAALALAALRQRIRAGDLPRSVTASLATATDALANAVAAELAHVKTWFNAFAEMEAELADLARRADAALSDAETAAVEAFSTSGNSIELHAAWLERSSAPAAVALRERRAFVARVVEAQHPLAVDGRKRHWHGENGPQVIEELTQALLLLAGND